MADVLPDALERIDSARAWDPAPAEIWNRKWAGHLLRRAAFGATPEELRRADREGLAKTLDRMMIGEPTAEDRLRLLADTGKRAAAGEIDALRNWWVYFLLHSGHPLRRSEEH